MLLTNRQTYTSTDIKGRLKLAAREPIKVDLTDWQPVKGKRRSVRRWRISYGISVRQRQVYARCDTAGDVDSISSVVHHSVGRHSIDARLHGITVHSIHSRTVTKGAFLTFTGRRVTRINTELTVN